EDATASLRFGGRYLRVDSTMTTGATPEMPAMTMNSAIFMGYDNARQKYVQVMLGDWMTGLDRNEGTYDEATKTFTMNGVETMGPGMERKFVMRMRVVSHDEWTLEVANVQP